MITRDKWVELMKDFHEKALPELIDRNISIPLDIPLKRAISIIGPRRSGKTYTMYRLIKNLLKENVTIDRILYVNFEKTDLEGCNSKDLINMLEIYYEIYPKNKNKKIWLFLDEIQNVGNWEKFVRTIIDYEIVQVIVSGSSSKLLSKEIATALRGRTITYTILPFSFLDYLIAQNIELKKYFSSSERARITSMLRDYMKDGGYPEVVLFKQEKEKILSDIVETTVYKDVIERYKIRNVKLLKLLIKSLINSAGREFSIHKFYNFVKSLGMKASKNALYNYVNALNDVFFVFPVSRFSYSYKKAEQSLPKICLIDNGVLSINGINDNGKLMENLVFVELIRRGKSVYYYKSVDGKEVDFLILKKNKVEQLLQVAYTLDDYITKEREIKALVSASKELKCKNLVILSWEKDAEDKIKGIKIKFIPLWKWLLNN